MDAQSNPHLPLWLKLGYTGWMLVWVPAYWVYHEPVNFLWFCDLASFILAAAVWLESPLLFSSQAVGVLLVQVLWVLDVLCRLLFGLHPIVGTEYMFDPGKPLWLRLLSLFHVAMPVLLVWGIVRLGYDRRGWRLQTALAWVVLPICYFATDPERNLNWVFRPFEVEVTWASPGAVFLACMVAYPLVLYLPSHLALATWAKRSGKLLDGDRATWASALPA